MMVMAWTCSVDPDMSSSYVSKACGKQVCSLQHNKNMPAMRHATMQHTLVKNS